MDEEALKAWDKSRVSAVPSFLIFLLLALLTVAGAVYFGGELFGSGRPQPAVVDFLCALLFVVAGTCLTVSVFYQWRRFRAAPNRKVFRSIPTSTVEQGMQIAGSLLLCIGFLIPTRLTSAEGKPATSNLPMAFAMGIFAAACIFGFFHERAGCSRSREN